MHKHDKEQILTIKILTKIENNDNRTFNYDFRCNPYNVVPGWYNAEAYKYKTSDGSVRTDKLIR